MELEMVDPTSDPTSLEEDLLNIYEMKGRSKLEGIITVSSELNSNKI